MQELLEELRTLRQELHTRYEADAYSFSQVSTILSRMEKRNQLATWIRVIEGGLCIVFLIFLVIWFVVWWIIGV